MIEGIGEKKQGNLGPDGLIRRQCNHSPMNVALRWIEEPISVSFNIIDGYFDFRLSPNALKNVEQFILHGLGISVSTKNKDDERLFWKSGFIDLWIGEDKDYIIQDVSLALFNPDIVMPDPAPKGVKAWERFRKLILELNLTRYYSLLVGRDKLPLLIHPRQEPLGRMIIDRRIFSNPDDLDITLFMKGHKGKV